MVSKSQQKRLAIQNPKRKPKRKAVDVPYWMRTCQDQTDFYERNTKQYPYSTCSFCKVIKVRIVEVV